MQGPGGRIVVNPAFEEWVYEDEKPTMVIPVKRQTTHYVEEGIAQSNSANDGRKKQQLQGSYNYGKVVSTHGSSRVLLLLVAFLCVMSIAAIVLLNVGNMTSARRTIKVNNYGYLTLPLP